MSNQTSSLMEIKNMTSGSILDITLVFSGNSTLTSKIFSKTPDLSKFTIVFFVVLAVLCLLLQILARKTLAHLSVGNNRQFLSFQRSYFAVYFLALFGDWLQGPYVYQLYSHYGYIESQIAAFYVAGFAASVLFGTVTGSMADKFGRKRLCIVFSLTYSLCCLTKVSPNYFVLMLGRILGGISTSLLFSTFESWYVYEHVQTHDFPKEWISVTFAKATFWNGILAIVAGIVAGFTSDVLKFGPVSPFIVAIPCLLTSGLFIGKWWGENYGEKQGRSLKNCLQGLKLVFADEKILLLGAVQSLFESVMYIFVFLWTPILEPGHPPLGLVFSVFMMCIMVGSTVYQILTARKVKSSRILMVAVLSSLTAVSLCSLSTDPKRSTPLISYVGFLILEFAVGMYFPAIGFLKSQVIPESHRANIMNWFRVPLNIITCVVLLWLHSEVGSQGNQIIFIFCTLMMITAAVLMAKLKTLLSKQEEDLTEELSECSSFERSF